MSKQETSHLHLLAQLVTCTTSSDRVKGITFERITEDVLSIDHDGIVWSGNRAEWHEALRRAIDKSE